MSYFARVLIAPGDYYNRSIGSSPSSSPILLFLSTGLICNNNTELLVDTTNSDIQIGVNVSHIGSPPSYRVCVNLNVINSGGDNVIYICRNELPIGQALLSGPTAAPVSFETILYKPSWDDLINVMYASSTGGGMVIGAGSSIMMFSL